METKRDLKSSVQIAAHVAHTKSDAGSGAIGSNQTAQKLNKPITFKEFCLAVVALVAIFGLLGYLSAVFPRISDWIAQIAGWTFIILITTCFIIGRVPSWGTTFWWRQRF